MESTLKELNNNTMSLTEAKAKGIRFVLLNGFRMHINYVMSLSDVTWVGEVKSDDGNSTIQCYERLNYFKRKFDFSLEM